MKNTITLLFLSIAFIVSAQKVDFKPDWKKGEKKSISYETVETEIKNGEKTEEAYVYDGILEVIFRDKKNLVLQLTHENIAMRKAVEAFEKLEEEYDDYYTIVYRFDVNVETGEYDIINWEEIRDRNLKNYESLMGLFSNKGKEAGNSEVGGFIELILGPILEEYSKEESIREVANEELKFIMLPFEGAYVDGGANEKVEEGENPFDPSKTLSVTERTTMTDYSTSEAHFVYNMEFDLDQFMGMIKQMMMEMATMFMEEGEEMPEDKLKEFDDFTMDMEVQVDLDFNVTSNWVKKVVQSAKVSMNEPGKGKMEKTTVTTVLVR